MMTAVYSMQDGQVVVPNMAVAHRMDTCDSCRVDPAASADLRMFSLQFLGALEPGLCLFEN